MHDSEYMQGWYVREIDGQATLKQVIYTSSIETQDHLPASDPRNGSITQAHHSKLYADKI